jgi:hypothetical protein
LKKITTSLAVTFLFVTAVMISSLPPATKAQTRNQTSKTQITEHFTFPNECTHELMEVSDTTTITCHDQQRSDGTFLEKCEIRQDVNATGQTTGIAWHGSATFKDDFVTTDTCDFSFSNRGTIHLISSGPAVNTVITIDELVIMDHCVLTADQHLVSFDCRGRQ